eukprot:3446049-Lingulodinium_polyedra.AAC.1
MCNSALHAPIHLKLSACGRANRREDEALLVMTTNCNGDRCTSHASAASTARISGHGHGSAAGCSSACTFHTNARHHMHAEWTPYNAMLADDVFLPSSFGNW